MINLGKLGENFWVIRNTLFIIIYAVLALFVYDLVAEFHIREPTHLFTPLDYSIPPIMTWAIVYVFIFYPFVLYTIAYFSYIKPDRSLRFFVSLFIIYAVSYITYIVFPVEMIRPTLDINSPNFFERVMAKYYESDPPLNCFPSLHAANSSIAAYHLSKENKKLSPIFWLIALLVMISTLFVRQHVIADEIAGFLVAVIAGKISDKYVKKEEISDKYLYVRIAVALIIATLVTVFLVSAYI